MRGHRHLLSALVLILARHALATTAADIPCSISSPPPGPCVVTVSVAVGSGAVLDFATRGLVIAGTGMLNAGGGSMTIQAASLVLQPKGVLASDGGAITVNTTGGVQLQANPDGSGRSRIDVSGTYGGTIDIVAGGDVAIAGQVLAPATSTQGFGGTIDVTGAGISTTTSAKVNAAGGSAGGGGAVSLSASATDLLISGSVDVSSAGDGGSISIDAERDVITTATAELNLKSGEAGSGDIIEIFTSTGRVSLDGTVSGTAPGSLDGGGGSGAEISVDAATSITVDAAIDLSGGGVDGTGGDAEFLAGGDIRLRAPLDVSASGTSGYAGSVDIDATYSNTGMVDIQADIDAIGPASGSYITISSYDDVQVSSRLTADGAAPSILIEGCGVRVTGTGRLSSLGMDGTNVLRASGQMTVAGTLQATASNGLQFLDLTKPPVVTGVVTPAPTIVHDPTLTPCGGPPPTTTTTTISTTSTSTSTTATTSTTVSASSTSTTVAPATSTTSTVTITTTSTTGASITTTSSTTATMPSTTTSTARPPTTTSTTAAPTTTSTTIAPVACDPPDCNDQDLCTDDSCDPVAGCVHDPRAGLDAVTCRLDTLSNTIAVTPATDVGGSRAQRRLQVKVGKAHRMVDVARRSEGKRRAARLRHASRLLGSFIRAVQRGEQRGKIEPGIGGRLLELATGAESQLLPLVNQ